jgi:hypothetical protein
MGPDRARVHPDVPVQSQRPGLSPIIVLVAHSSSPRQAALGTSTSPLPASDLQRFSRLLLVARCCSPHVVQGVNVRSAQGQAASTKASVVGGMAGDMTQASLDCMDCGYSHRAAGYLDCTRAADGMAAEDAPATTIYAHCTSVTCCCASYRLLCTGPTDDRSARLQQLKGADSLCLFPSHID